MKLGQVDHGNGVCVHSDPDLTARLIVNVHVVLAYISVRPLLPLPVITV